MQSHVLARRLPSARYMYQLSDHHSLLAIYIDTSKRAEANCTNRQCGFDGIGGTCGTCNTGTVRCLDGQVMLHQTKYVPLMGSVSLARHSVLEDSVAWMVVVEAVAHAIQLLLVLHLVFVWNSHSPTTKYYSSS